MYSRETHVRILGRLGKKSILDSIRLEGYTHNLTYLYLIPRSAVRFAGSHVRSTRLPRGGHVARSARDLLNRRGSRPDPDRESARAQSAPGSRDLRVSGLFVGGLRRDAQAVSGAA